MFVDESDRYSVYTRRVTPESIDADSVKTCPVLLQEEIPRGADVRATFIGPKWIPSTPWTNPKSQPEINRGSRLEGEK
jgi:hypothetical protein